MKSFNSWGVILLVFLFLAQPAQGGWVEIGIGSASGGGISNTSTSSSFPGTNSKALVIGTDCYPIAAWSEYVDTNWEIYVRKWDGSAWVEMGTGSASGGGISNNSGDSDRASIAIGPDGNPIVLWDDNTSGDNEEYLKRWDGSAWVEMGTGSASGGGISNNTGSSLRNSIVIGSDGYPIIVWGDNSSGNDEIYLKKWNGSAWVEMPTGSASSGGISSTSGMSRQPFIILGSDGNPIVTWIDYSIGNWEIYVKRWNGSAWVVMGTGSASGGGISSNTGDSQSPFLLLGSDGNPMVTWHDNSSGNYEVYIKRWNGSAWVVMGTGSASGGGISNTAGTSYNPSFALGLDGNLFIVWWDNSSGDNEIYVKRWDGSAWVEISAGSASGGGISNNTAESSHSFIAAGSDGKPIVAWDDGSCSNQEIYILKYDPDLEPAQNLRAIPGDGKATLIWERSTSPGVVSYQIYSDNGSGSTVCSSPVTSVVHPQESVVISNLTNNQTYLFDLRTMNNLNELTAEPNLVSVTPIPDPTGMVRAIIKIPQTGKRINGNRTLVMAELEYGQISEVSSILFQYKSESESSWTDIPNADLQHPNPDLTHPYFIHWDVTGLASGFYNLRAVAYDQSNISDANPPFITITVDHQSPHETRTVNTSGEPETDSTVYYDKDNSIILGAENDTLIDLLLLPSGALDNFSDLLVYFQGCSDEARNSVLSSRSIWIFRSLALTSGQTDLGSGLNAQVTISYPDSDQDGVVDGTSINEIELTAAWYGPTGWEDISGTVDSINNQVIFLTSHFSNFAILGPVTVSPSTGGNRSSRGLKLGSCGADGGLGFSFLAVLGGIFLLKRKRR